MTDLIAAEPIGSTVMDHLAAQFAAIEAGDMAAFANTFAPDAMVWHNFDEVAQDVATASVALAALYKMSSRIKYQDQRIVASGSLRFVQHVLTADLHNGAKLHLPAMMRVELAEDGRVARLEEYFDSRAIDCLRAPAHLAPSQHALP